MANAARVVNHRPGPGQGDGLVEPFAAGVHRLAQGGQGLARLDEMLHLIYIVQVQRTEIQGFHATTSLLML